MIWGDTFANGRLQLFFISMIAIAELVMLVMIIIQILGMEGMSMSEELELTNEEEAKIIEDMCENFGLDAHIKTAYRKADMGTWAEQMMWELGSKKGTHYKESCLRLSCVDACFYIEHHTACVTFVAKWAGMEELGSQELIDAMLLVKNMIQFMQIRIDAKLLEKHYEDRK